jgi:pectate lyase
MRKFLVLVPLLGILFFCSKSIAQCTVPGWASLNGGVTGGGSATPKIVTNYNELKAAITSSTEKVVHISGTIVIPSGGRILFQDQSNKTIYGLPGSKLVSNDLTKDASGILYMKKCSNILFQNVTLEGPGAYDTDGWDNMTIDNSTNVWVDHCEFQDGMDGNLDIKNAADYISVTWCKFIYNKAPVPGGPGGANDHRFSDLFGSGDGATGDRGKLRVTMQNCWWAQGCKARMPRVRFGKVHIVNNLFNSTVAAQCVMAGFESDLLVERNVFENVKSPIDKLDNTFTAITVRGNIFNNIIGDTTGSGTAFTPPYALLAAPVTNVKSRVMAGAGATLTSPSCNATTSYILNTTVTPTAGGTVAGGGTYNAGTSATITATPATGYTFTGWSGAATGTSSSVTVAMDANKSVTANFQAQVSAYILSTTASPTAGGTVTGAGTYNAGSYVTVTATPATGYIFTGWSGAATGTSSSVTVTMDGNKSVTANFQAQVSTYILSTTASPTAGGTVTGAGSYSSGATATLTANPATGYTFTGWSGDVSDASASVYVTMNANKSVTANFQAENSSGTSTIRIEDSALTSQGLCSYEGAISSNTGASNGKVINLSNSAGKGINWKVYIPSEGSYTFTWHYVNGGSSNAYTMALLVNGTTVNNALPFARTSGSTIFSTVAQTVTLKAGVNAIRLQSLSSAATADIDWIEITGNTPATADCTAAMSASARSVGTETESIVYSENAVRISPNPAKDNATITISLNKGEHAAIMVYDDQGNLVDTLSSDKAVVTGTQQVVYAVGNKRPGIYTIVVVNNKGAKTTYKLLVE